MIKSYGIILNTFPYSESSQILKVLTWDRAQISIIAKGWRKRNEALLPLVEYDFILYKPKEEGLYLLKEASPLRDFSSYASPSAWAAAECGAEIFGRILFPLEDNSQYYTLFSEYLGYLGKVKQNAILIFWRMLLRLYHLMGIPLKLTHCSSCQKEVPTTFLSPASEPLCQPCAKSLPLGYEIEALTDTTLSVLKLLPEIGNHLESIKLTQKDISQINRIFGAHFEQRQKQKLKLKSLDVLCLMSG